MFTASKPARIAVVAMSLGVIAGTTQFADAMPFHPRRTEVNARLTVQNWRINQAYKQGKITFGQAAALHADDRMIRHQERFDAKFDGGHITAAEQKTLNQLENGVSKNIP